MPAMNCIVAAAANPVEHVMACFATTRATAEAVGNDNGTEVIKFADKKGGG